MHKALKAPFPWFGGKRRVAALIWERFGEVDNYIEPFMGSAAVLLSRPTPPRVETVNDLDCYVANFWRATQLDPEAVVSFADGPVNEADLHARHRWLVLSDDAIEFRNRMRTNPDYFDPKVAGWWVWGLCCWIGGGWCTPHGETADGDRKQTLPADHGKGVTSNPLRGPRPALSGDNPGSYGKGIHARGPKLQLPDLSGDSGASGRGVHASGGPRGLLPQKVPNLTGRGASDVDKGVNHIPHEKRPNIGDRSSGSGVLRDNNRIQLADAFSRGRGVHSNDEAETCARRRAWLLDWFARLRDRLRTVRVCCGNWDRVCSSTSVTTRLGVTGIFFDPPYSNEADRNMNLYAVEDGEVAHAVRAYCLARGSDPLMRIALCGYEGEGHEELETAGWSVVSWEASGGYGNRSEKGKANAKRERIYFSPHCLKPDGGLPLFAGLGDE